MQDHHWRQWWSFYAFLNKACGIRFAFGLIRSCLGCVCRHENWFSLSLQPGVTALCAYGDNNSDRDTVAIGDNELRDEVAGHCQVYKLFRVIMLSLVARQNELIALC